MIVQCITHVPFEGPGSITRWAERRRAEIKFTRFFEGDPSPATENFDLLLIMGGPMSVLEEDLYPWLVTEKQLVRDAIAAGKKLMGICLGAQMIANALGANIRKNPEKEIGWFPVHFREEALRNPLMKGFPGKKTVFHWHGETFDLPPGGILMGSSEACMNQGYLIGQQVVGMQFHLEETSESLQEISSCCRAELIPGRFVQDEKQFVHQPDLANEANKLLFGLLDNLMELQ